jgi:hypothetical protein
MSSAIKNRKFFFLALFILLLGSNNLASQTESALTIRIDPDNAVGSTISEVFDSVTYIPLETTKESIFGKIDQLSITDNYFIILDKNTNCILFFLKDGKFHCKINGGNTTLNFYNTISRFSVDRFAKEIGFLKGIGKIVYYNFDGKKIREEKSTYATVDFYLFPEKKAVYYQYNAEARLFPDSNNYELKFVTAGKVRFGKFPYNMKTAPLQSREIYGIDHSPFHDTGEDSTTLYCRPYSYRVNIITPGSIREAYDFIFPLMNSLPMDFRDQANVYGNRNDYIKNHIGLIYNISNVYRIGDNLFFKLYKNTKTSEANSFIYNFKSGNTIALSHVVSDSFNYFLPVCDLNDSYPEFAIDNFYTTDGTWLYTTHSSAFMFRTKEANVDKKIHYSPMLENYFTKGNKKDNPVIVKVKPKERL